MYRHHRDYINFFYAKYSRKNQQLKGLASKKHSLVPPELGCGEKQVIWECKNKRKFVKIFVHCCDPCTHTSVQPNLRNEIGGQLLHETFNIVCDLDDVCI